jgi:hypothetical protein
LKTKEILFAISVILFSGIVASAQPFTLDKKLKPVMLKLEPNTKYEGSKYVETSATINKGETAYYYIVGHDMYQFVDVFIFANDGDPDIQADVVYNTWDNIEETKHTKTAEDGIINFKIRSYQDISFTIKTLDGDNVSYSIIVNASPPAMAHLGSPFIKATTENADLSETPEARENASSGTPLWLYAIIGLLLLVVGLLAGKLLGRKNTLSVILFLILAGVSGESFGQTLPRSMEDVDRANTRRGQVDKGIEQINKAFGTAKAAEDFLDKYKNLGNCLKSAPPPGQPRIPSFCEDEGDSCAGCFLNARKKFNEVRYRLEKLQTIYDCTKSYTDAAVSFGDNVSSYHGVTGLVWQAQRRNVERSIVGLNKSYDEKRIELLKELNESLIALNACEQEHGIKDWYDRFGVMFYNFSEMRYHR